MGVDRSGLRSAVVTKLALITGVSAVYSSLPKKTDGKSPLITVESGPTKLSSTPEEPNYVGLMIGLWVRRDDADDAESSLDGLLDSVADALEAYFNVMYPEPSAPDYDVVDGVIYRIEWLPVSIQWW